MTRSSLAVAALAFSVASVASSTLFAASARADESACIAASESALTARRAGKLHDALHQLSICSAASCSSEVRQECTQRVAQITSAMPTLILSAKDGAGNDLASVNVAMDGAPLVSTLDGRPLSIDPGSHTFRFVTAGEAPVDKVLVLREGDHDRREGVVLGKIVAPPATAGTPGPFWTTPRRLALVSGGAGVVGLGVGALFAAFALSAKHDESSACGSSATCANRPQANEDYDTAKHNATGATIGFIAGGVFLATGAVLWITAPDANAGAGETTAGGAKSGARIGLAPSANGLVLGGAF